MIPYMVRKLVPHSSHLTRGLVKSVPGRGYFRAVPSQNGDKYATSPPPQLLNLSSLPTLRAVCHDHRFGQPTFSSLPKCLKARRDSHYGQVSPDILLMHPNILGATVFGKAPPLVGQFVSMRNSANDFYSNTPPPPPCLNQRNLLIPEELVDLCYNSSHIIWKRQNNINSRGWGMMTQFLRLLRNSKPVQR